MNKLFVKGTAASFPSSCNINRKANWFHDRKTVAENLDSIEYASLNDYLSPFHPSFHAYQSTSSLISKNFYVQNNLITLHVAGSIKPSCITLLGSCWPPGKSGSHTQNKYSNNFLYALPLQKIKYDVIFTLKIAGVNNFTLASEPSLSNDTYSEPTLLRRTCWYRYSWYSCLLFTDDGVGCGISIGT